VSKGGIGLRACPRRSLNLDRSWALGELSVNRTREDGSGESVELRGGL
jgi:hypothetical protein